MSVQFAVLLVTLFTLFFSLNRLRKVLFTSNMQKMLKKREKDIEELKELIAENRQGAFITAWFISVSVTLFFSGISIYILSNMIDLS